MLLMLIVCSDGLCIATLSDILHFKGGRSYMIRLDIDMFKPSATKGTERLYSAGQITPEKNVQTGNPRFIENCLIPTDSNS